jgi:hypothetical protein
MIIDAMDILYTKNVEGFCIVSSDSDFTKLASRLRESGMLVVGMGEKKTPKPFIAACNQFKYLDVIAEAEKKRLECGDDKTKAQTQKLGADVKLEETVKTIKSTGPQDNSEIVKNMTDKEMVKATIIKMMNEIDAEEQSMNIADLGNKLVKRYPDFDVRNYGYTKLSRFLKEFDFLNIEPKGKNGTALWVSLKSEHSVPQLIKTTNTPKRKKTIKKK